LFAIVSRNTLQKNWKKLFITKNMLDNNQWLSTFLLNRAKSRLTTLLAIRTKEILTQVN